jgi:small subunit ribosomal protein S11
MNVVHKKKKVKKIVQHACAYISVSYNNVLVTIADLDGNVLTRCSSGACGFRGSKKSTPYAGQVASERAMEAAMLYGIEDIQVFVKGIGPGREQSIRGLSTKSQVEILSIVDKTPMPHNGCRPSKRRKV